MLDVAVCWSLFSLFLLYKIVVALLYCDTFLEIFLTDLLYFGDSIIVTQLSANLTGH